MKNSGFFFLFAAYLSAIFFFAPLSITATLVSWGWVVLAVLAAGLGLSAIFMKPQFKVPPKKIALWILGLLALATVFSLAAGANLFEEKWSHRWVTLLLFAGLLQWFSTDNDLVKAVRYPLLAFALALCGEAIYQNFRVCPGSGLDTSCFSSRFYNINMLTQSLLMLVAILDFVKNGAHRRLQWLFRVALALAVLVIVYSQSRSAYIAISLYTLSRLLISKKEFLRFLLPLLLAVCVFKLDPRENAGTKPVDKKDSTSYRRELAVGSVKMISENPLGVGPNNFEYGFIQYRNLGQLPPTIGVVDKTPHNDFFLVLAEEGWAVGAAFIFLFAGLLLKALKSQWAARATGTALLWPGFLIIIFPEVLFQFPSDMHFFAFCTALVLAVHALGSGPVYYPVKNLLRSFALAAVLLIGVSGVLRYTMLVPDRYSAVYCTVFHDSWKNCGTYIKNHLAKRDYAQAELTAAPVLRYQKYNFIMQHWYFLLNKTEANKVIACNYASLFNFQASIPGSDITTCERNLSRQEIDRRISAFSGSL